MNHLEEFISVSLEILAFFFVTVDLYGEARLEALTERLIGLTSPVLKWGTHFFYKSLDIAEDKTFPTWPIGLVWSVVWVAVFTFFYVILRITPAIGPEIGNARYIPLVVFVPALATVLAFVASAVAACFTWLLKRARFSGVLLMVGTCLFLVAKGMIWLRLLHEITTGGHV